MLILPFLAPVVASVLYIIVFQKAGFRGGLMFVCAGPVAGAILTRILVSTMVMGDGPMAGLISIPVPDLTRIAARNGGTFPWLTVVHQIDGRSGLRGHGGPMPLFGALFSGDTAAADAPDGTPVITSARVLALTDWLASIQVAE